MSISNGIGLAKDVLDQVKRAYLTAFWRGLAAYRGYG